MFLHGWGGDIRSFGGAMDHFERRGRTCLTFSFPPFGASDMPPEDWNLSDYSALTLSLLDKSSFDKVILVGHSFGGRVAIDISSTAAPSRVEKLVLVDSAGLRPRRGPIYRLRRLRFRLAKKLGRPTEKYYSPDYLALPESMRGIFGRIVSRDQTEDVGKIKCPTLVFWGKRDKETPLYMCRRLIKKLGGKAIILNGGHFAYAEDHARFVAALGRFV